MLLAVLSNPSWKALPRNSHLDRSLAQRRDLRFFHPATNPTSADPLPLSSRPTGGICSAPRGTLKSFLDSAAPELSSRPKRSAVEGPAGLPSSNQSNLSRPSPLVIPTNGRDLQCAPRYTQILPGQRPPGLVIPTGA